MREELKFLDENEKIAAEFLLILGKYLRKIDMKMREEHKEPLSKRLLGKEDLSIEDLNKIVKKIHHRTIIYIESEGLEKLSIGQDNSELAEKFLKGLNSLMKRKVIDILIFYGYILR